MYVIKIHDSNRRTFSKCESGKKPILTLSAIFGLLSRQNSPDALKGGPLMDSQKWQFSGDLESHFDPAHTDAFAVSESSDN